MVLTNAERQARYKQRLRDAAAAGVTPEMVVNAAKLNFAAWVDSELDERITWEEMLADARKRKNASGWRQWVPSDPNDNYAEYGDDAAMMWAVAKVAHAVLNPPDAD